MPVRAREVHKDRGERSGSFVNSLGTHRTPKGVRAGARVYSINMLPLPGYHVTFRSLELFPIARPT